jgi:HD-GYP domain-containing protein (c-di-GMP phosphodiesterase class II)
MNIFTDERKMILNQCLEALGLVIEYNLNDHHTHQHALRVGEGSVIIGDKLGFSPSTLQHLYFAGLIHDVGKVSVPLEILNKKTSLTNEEFEIIKGHSVMGSRIVATLPELSAIAFWVRWHHENWDGSGYPDGLSGKEIPIEIQILSAVDCYDSLRTPRVDRPPLTSDEALDLVREYSGTHFNPEIVDRVVEMHENRELVPGQPSERFIEMKQKYIDLPMIGDGKGYMEGYGIAGLYPILRLFARIIDAKHRYTAGHSTRVSILARYIAETMGFPRGDVIKLEIAGLLHDAGKISIPTDLLDKPGGLSREEWQIIEKHPEHSANILSMIESFDEIAEIVLYHHKHADREGYPATREETYINYLSHILAVADSYDAITSHRAYNPARSPETAYSIIREGLGTRYDRRAGEALLSIPVSHIEALYDMHRQDIDWSLQRDC